MAQTTDVAGIPPRGLTVEVLVAGMLFSVSAGCTGLAALSPQHPPSALLMLGWPMFAVVGGVLLDQRPGLRLGRTMAALSLAPVVIIAWSVIHLGHVEAADLADAAADLAALVGCTLAIALPWALGTPAPSSSEPFAFLGSCGLAVIGAVIVVAARAADWPVAVRGVGWVLAVAATLSTWTLAARSVRRVDRASRRRMAWLLLSVGAACALVSATFVLWPGRPGYYATCGVLLTGSILIANLSNAETFRPLDEHLLDVGLVVAIAATSGVVTGLVSLGSELAHRPSNTTTVVFTALLTATMAAPSALWIRRSVLARRYGSGLLPPEDVAAITADLHAKTEPRDLLDKAARMVAAASGSVEVRIVLGDDDPSPPDDWTVRRLEVGGDRVGSLLIASPDPEGPEARQQEVVAQLLPTVALVARAVGLAVEAEHARRDVARERDAERKRVLGDLHDGLGPALAGMSMRVQAARRTATSSEDATLLADLADGLARSRTDLRRIVSGITPSTLDGGDLEGALRMLVDSFRDATDDPQVRLTVDLVHGVAPAVQVAVYRSVAEGITNGLRHAAAATIDVAVRARDGRVHVDVVDDGVGGRVVPGVGLSSLARRAESLGGQMTICAGASGTTLHLDLPTSGGAS